LKIIGNKTLISIAIVLMLTTSTLIAGISFANAAVRVTVLPYFYPVIGVNSATLINWRPSPGVLFDAPYATQDKVWADAVVTFTRPDGTTDVVNGPFQTTFQIPGRDVRDIELIYTPNMMGNWKVKFFWPGDGNLSAVTDESTFTVGQHFERRPSWAMLSLRPYPAIGIGQSMLVNAWVTPPPFTDRDFYQNFDFIIRKPDGSIAYEFPMFSEGPGTVWWEFVFDQIGEWKITFNFPGDFFTLPCTVTRSITVQQEQIPYPIKDTPLPTEPWSFPVSVYNREWRNIAGPWEQSNYNASSGAWNPFTQAPKTAHILWEKAPVASLGGFSGATHDVPGIESDATYSPSSVSIRTMMAGRGYYTAGGAITCVDMKTGEVLWTRAGESFNVGAVRSGVPTLYSFGSSRLIAYNGISGAVTLNVTGASMNFFDDPYAYTYVGAQQSTTAARNGTGYFYKWTVAGSSTNFTTRIIWNTTIPASWLNQPSASSHSVMQSNLIITRQFQGGTIMVEAFSGINCTTGAIEYYTPVIDKTDTKTWIYRQGPAIGSGYDLIYFGATAYPTQLDPPNRAGGYLAYNAKTGNLAWAAESATYPWGNFFAYMPQACAENKIIGLSYDGVHAYDKNTGKQLWHYQTGNSGMETPYNTWAFGSTGCIIGGGVIFAPNTEHSPTLSYRGERMNAIDINTGKALWTLNGYYSPTAIAFGIFTATEQTSGEMYAFGKGETKTTVAVQNDVYTKGSTVLIKGTITDQSPAQKGTAAISDASMTAWMEYKHRQMPIPGNATGVPVTLTAVDSAGNPTTIGTVTSDMTGNYAYAWTPQTEGTYMIIASFMGSESYYASYEETPIAVTAAPSPAPTATPTVAPTASPTTIPTPPAGGIGTEVYIAIAAIVIIAIIVAVAMLLRRRGK
jgi:hypothetical protein